MSYTYRICGLYGISRILRILRITPHSANLTDSGNRTHLAYMSYIQHLATVGEGRWVARYSNPPLMCALFKSNNLPPNKWCALSMRNICTCRWCDEKTCRFSLFLPMLCEVSRLSCQRLLVKCLSCRHTTLNHDLGAGIIVGTAIPAAELFYVQTSQSPFSWSSSAAQDSPPPVLVSCIVCLLSCPFCHLMVVHI